MKVKICGVTTPDAAVAIAEAGSDYLGINFFPKSPRFVDTERARAIGTAVGDRATRVVLLVDPDDALVDTAAALPIDMLQLHGKETADRVSEIRTRAGLPVMKVIGISDADDLPRISAYESVADQIMVDAKPPRGAPLPGGNGLRFDWRLIAGRAWSVPWMLAGGLTPDNVGEAIRLTGTVQVDVASGVESTPGEKDLGKVRAFVGAAKAA